MEASVYRILLVDDRHADDHIIQSLLSEPQGKCFQFYRVAMYEVAIRMVRFEQWDAILVNRDFDNHTGLEFIHHVRLWNTSVPLILFSDRYDNQLEYKGRKVGAVDYFAKDSLTLSVLRTFLRDHQPVDQRKATSLVY